VYYIKIGIRINTNIRNNYIQSLMNPIYKPHLSLYEGFVPQEQSRQGLNIGRKKQPCENGSSVGPQ
jgi:hypothetical protein